MWDSLNWERTNRKTSANGHFLIRMKFFFKRKKICSSVLVELKCWKSKITCQGEKCCHWQSSIPQIPRPNESLKRLASDAKSRLLPEKGFLNRTDCELKIRSTVTYIASFSSVEFRSYRYGAAMRYQICRDRGLFCHVLPLNAQHRSHRSELNKKGFVQRCDVFYVHTMDTKSKTQWILTVPKYKPTCNTFRAQDSRERGWRLR